jgi:hypothetical protein
MTIEIGLVRSGVVLRLARKNDIHRSKLLLPIAVAALGGSALMVLIGILPLRSLIDYIKFA